MFQFSLQNENMFTDIQKVMERYLFRKSSDLITAKQKNDLINQRA